MPAAATDRGTARLSALIEEARRRARRSGRSVLVSLAEPAPALDPLEVVARGRDGDGAAGRLAREATMYWERPAGEVAIAGLGAVASLVASGADRFSEVDGAWAALRADAVVDDPSGGAAGVGPILMGGFAFEAATPAGTAWSGFPGALLVLPRLQVARVGGDCWITASLLVGPDGATDVEAPAIAELRDDVLRTGAAPSDRGTDPGAEVAFEDLQPADEWRALVASTTAVIRTGAMDKVVLARAVHARSAASLDPVAALRRLRADFPTTHVFGIWRGARAFVGATPERLVRLAGDVVESSSLAGSVRRGASAAEDAERAAELLGSAKDRAEHELVRRELCAGLATVCDDVEAPEVPSLLTLPHVHHLHTPVRARLRAGHSLLELVGVIHPTPAVGGAPRAVALDYLREHEPLERGWYAAPVGWIGAHAGEFAVALRSGVVAPHDAWLFAGCGIVADSDPASEYAESELKLRPMRHAVAAAARARGRTGHTRPQRTAGQPAR